MEGIGSIIPQITQLVEDSLAPELVDLPQERKGVYMIVGSKGEQQIRLADPAWHNEQLESPLALAAFISAQNLDKSVGAVYVDAGRVTFIYDQADRRNRAFVVLKTSPQFNWFLKQSQELMSQADIVRLLRITLRGCVSDSSRLLEIMRKLQLKQVVENGGDIQHGRESMGRNIVAQATGAADIPEEATFDVPVYENHSFRTKIACAIEVFPADGRFRLTPYPMELQTAGELALDDVSFTFSKPTMPPVFRGTVFPAGRDA